MRRTRLDRTIRAATAPARGEGGEFAPRSTPRRPLRGGRARRVILLCVSCNVNGRICRTAVSSHLVGDFAIYWRKALDSASGQGRKSATTRRERVTAVRTAAPRR